MLSDFVTKNHSEILARSRARAAERSTSLPAPEKSTNGIPLFLDQLSDALQARTGKAATDLSAARHAARCRPTASSFAQVVQGYGDVCVTITELAREHNAPIAVADVRKLNAVLDDAIADAVTAYSRRREEVLSQGEEERLASLAHDLRNGIGVAMLAYGLLKDDPMGTAGRAGAVLERNLRGLQDLINESLADMRAGLDTERNDCDHPGDLAGIGPPFGDQGAER
jgi:hypothetical protein